MLNLFCTFEKTCDFEEYKEYLEYVTKSHGVNVAFVFDGFDEFPSALQKESFITDLIKGENDGRMFLNSTFVVTSRPTATLFLHNSFDRRIEILGFPKTEREKYISLSLRDSFDQIQKLDKYLKQHPAIDNLCYIPLHLAILVHLFQQDSLPETLTEMNEFFIINTIFRYLQKNNQSQSVVIKKLTDFSEDVVEFVNKLAHLAFKGLKENQLVFELDKIKEMCPEIYKIPNGYGLLQAVQHYPQRGAGRTTSVNFLHFTMQEYLAALHVSTLPNKKQLSLMRESFWKGPFSFMWMMYVGIVGVKSSSFTTFIASASHSKGWDAVINRKYNPSHILHRGVRDNVYDDKRKCLHLFQCYLEAKSNAEMPKMISSIFIDGKIELNGLTLLPHHISSLIFFMSTSTMQQWKILALCYCNLRDIGMNSLLEYIIKNDRNMSRLEYVDLSGNGSSPWVVYCVIIRHCYLNRLTLCGDEGMEKYSTDIRDSLQKCLTLKSLTLCKIGREGIKLIEVILFGNVTLTELCLSWESNANGTKIIKRQLKEVCVNILCDHHFKCLPKTIDLSRGNINDDAAHVIAFGLYNNTTVEKLDLSYNRITIYGMIKLSQCITHAISVLEYVDLSRNQSPPWFVYCALIKHCCVSKLTLCGNEGMQKYVNKVVNSLQINTTLQSLTLCAYNSKSNEGRCEDMIAKANFTEKPLNLLNINGKLYFSGPVNRYKGGITKRVVNVNVLCDFDDECLYEYISLPGKNVSGDTLSLLTFGLYNNVTVKKLDLSFNEIRDEEAVIISHCLKYNNTLQVLNFSRNKITVNGAVVISDYLKYNKTLKEVNFSYNFIDFRGVVTLSEVIKYVEYVDLNGNKPIGIQ